MEGLGQDGPKKIPPRWPPSRSQDCPKMRLNGPRMAPKWPPDGLRCPQDCLKMLQGGPGRNKVRQKQPEDPEAAQSEAGTAQRAANSSPEQTRNSPKQQQTRSNPEAPKAAHLFKFQNFRPAFPEQVHSWYGPKEPEKTLSAREARTCV